MGFATGATAGGGAAAVAVELDIDELEQHLAKPEHADNDDFASTGIFTYWLDKVGRCKLNPG